MLPYLNIFGIQIPMYGVCMSLAIALAIVLSCVRAHRRGQSWEDLLSIAVVAVLFGIVGSKLLYIFVTYSLKEIGEKFSSQGISFFLNSGVVFYGGLLGGILGALVGARIFKKKLVCYCDAIVPTLPLAHAIGRMGCFCAGCCYGRETDSWIGMCFPHSVSGLSDSVRVIPTQLIESGANLLVFAFLIWFTRKRRKGYTSLFVYLMIYAVVRFIIEYLRGDDYRGIFGSFSTSQWISMGLFALGIVGLILTRIYYSRRHQAIGALGAGLPAGEPIPEPLVFADDEAEPAAEEVPEAAYEAVREPDGSADERGEE